MNRTYRCCKPQKHFLGIIFFFLFSFSFNINSSALEVEKIFKLNCAVCHSLGANKLVGPGLEGVANRVPKPTDEWLTKWIRNSIEVLQSGDPYAKKIFVANGNIPMPPFPALKEEEIKAIIAYIKAPPPVAAPSPFTGIGQQTGVFKKYPVLFLLVLIALLIIVIVVLRGRTYTLNNLRNKKMGLPPEQKINFRSEIKRWMSNHKRSVALIIIFIVCGLLQAGWDSLKNIGIYQGYQPVQPIAFSHKIHSGASAINCLYCHSGAEKSKTAGIPSVDICMNCHKGISKGPVYGTAEIAKIYDAAGWDPLLGAYTKPQKPIQWVKVHVLADFVFFSHQQHVVVGKQNCANCHGDMATMTVTQQVQPLTMVWCINCHKTTEVPGMYDNPYYADLHAKLAEKFKGQPFTVDKIGGTECGKCHY